MFTSILNNEHLIFNNASLTCVEKYRSLKFESYSTKKTKFEYENGDIVIFFIGSLYNSTKLLQWLNVSYDNKSNISTCPDIIAHIYKKYGFEYMLNVVDGVFSLVLLDQRINNSISKIYIIADDFGIVPLFTMIPTIANDTESRCNLNSIVRGFSTDYDFLLEFANELNLKNKLPAYPNYTIRRLQTGCYHKFTASNKVSCIWEVNEKPIKTFTIGCGRSAITSLHTRPVIEENVRTYIIDAINKRMRVIKTPYVVCVIDPNNYESVIVACVINQYLAINSLYNCELRIFFTEFKNRYCSYLKEILNIENVCYMDSNSIDMEFIKTKMNGLKYTIFSSLSISLSNIEVHCGDSLMDMNRKLIESFPLIDDKIIHGEMKNIQVVYPLLDTIWMNYYLSIDLSYRKRKLIEQSFHNFEYIGGISGTFTLE